MKSFLKGPQWCFIITYFSILVLIHIFEGKISETNEVRVVLVSGFLTLFNYMPAEWR